MLVLVLLQAFVFCFCLVSLLLSLFFCTLSSSLLCPLCCGGWLVVVGVFRFFSPYYRKLGTCQSNTKQHTHFPHLEKRNAE